MIMRSPDLEGSSTLAAAPSTSPTPTPSSPSLTRTPRWGSIRQRFSSIQSRDSISANADSVDDGMWDKNDTAFLEEVARASPLLLASPDRSDSLAPVLEHDQARLTIHPSSRTFEDASHSSYYRRSMQPQPSSASSSTLLRQHLQPRPHPRPWSPTKMSLVQVLYTATPNRGLVPCAGWPPPPSCPICRNRSAQTTSSPSDAPPQPRPRLSFCLPSVLPLRSCWTTLPLRTDSNPPTEGAPRIQASVPVPVSRTASTPAPT